jgi:hypothetical protein
MISRRAEVLAFCAFLLAAAAFVRTWWPGVPTASANPESAAAVADIPVTFNYQGILRAADGSLITGDRDMTFKIYADPVGDNSLHSETVNGVPVHDGVFNVVLGDDVGNPIGSDVFADAPRYLGITVGSDREMVPRQRLHPVPWALSATEAYHAAEADDATAAASAQTADTLVSNATVDGLTVSGTGLTVSGTELTVNGSNGLQVVGDASVTNNLNVGAIREVGDSSNNGAKTEQPYDVSLRRYVLEATDGGTTPTSVEVDDTYLRQLCLDADGCTFTLGMRNWNTEGTLATYGPIRLSLAQSGGQRYWDVRYQNGNEHLAGVDGNGVTNHLRNVWDSCYLTDGEYQNGSDVGDTGIGLHLLNWHGENDSADMVCVLIIED